MKYKLTGLLALALMSMAAAKAEITVSAPDGFELKLEKTSLLAPAELYDRVGEISEWWSAPHTYSGAAENLYITKLDPGGVWLEDWSDGRVEHGRVIARTINGEEHMLRFEAPLGPLQAMGVKAVLTVTITPDTDETTPEESVVSFQYSVTGASFQQLDQIAPAVDGVLSEQITNLATD